MYLVYTRELVSIGHGVWNRLLKIYSVVKFTW